MPRNADMEAVPNDEELPRARRAHDPAGDKYFDPYRERARLRRTGAVRRSEPIATVARPVHYGDAIGDRSNGRRLETARAPLPLGVRLVIIAITGIAVI